LAISCNEPPRGAMLPLGDIAKKYTKKSTA
jgi:hypothetical protein